MHPALIIDTVRQDHKIKVVAAQRHHRRFFRRVAGGDAAILAADVLHLPRPAATTDAHDLAA